MMPGVQFKEVWDALNSGYTKATLAQMLRVQLDVVLEDIVADDAKENIKPARWKHRATRR